MAENVKKYNKMETVLNDIQKHYVSLSDVDRRHNIQILLPLIDQITSEMKLKDSLFREMFERVFFGGSYYDGLRVCEPTEFDLDLLLKLPKLIKPEIETSNNPGYVHVKITEYNEFMKQPEMVRRYKGLEKLMQGNGKVCYLDTSKVLRWMEKVVNLALNEFEKERGQYIIECPNGIFYVKMRKSGPAFTLGVTSNIGGSSTSLDIDLVPCFLFGKDKWPVNGFRKNPINSKPDFFIVPKPLKEGVSCGERYWRLSFQEQERVIIDGKKTLKPTVKLLKKLRDTRDHTFISSYYIKTVLLWQTDEVGDEFWNKPLSYVFMNVLNRYHAYLNNGSIPYYWYKRNNLLKNIGPHAILNTSNNIKHIIDDIEKHLDDPLTIAKHLLTEEELNEYKGTNDVSDSDSDYLTDSPTDKPADSHCQIL